MGLLYFVILCTLFASMVFYEHYRKKNKGAAYCTAAAIVIMWGIVTAYAYVQPKEEFQVRFPQPKPPVTFCGEQYDSLSLPAYLSGAQRGQKWIPLR